MVRQGIKDPVIIKDADGVAFTRDKAVLIQYPVERKGAYVIPDGVTRIWNEAFRYCEELTAVTIPATVEKIESYAFGGCTGLTEVIVPGSITEINAGVFESCTGLSSVTIPDSVVKIGSYAFQSCKSLTGITIPQSVVELGYRAFANCSRLSTVTMSPKLKHKRNDVFKGCVLLPFIAEAMDRELKKQKVLQMQKKSSADWISYLADELEYPYNIDKHYATKIVLKVRISEKQLLEIPVLHSKFDKTIPRIKDLIERIKTFIQDTEIKFMLYDVHQGIRWSQPKKKS